jgi:polyribonucleotide 5'-hydroxyl-kinase
VARRDKAFRRQTQMRKIREYFYGHTGTCELSPFSLVVSFDDVKIFRIGEGKWFWKIDLFTMITCFVEHLVPSSALPLGADRKMSGTRLVPIEAGDILLHSILAIVDATPRGAQNADATEGTSEGPEEEETLVFASVLGFIYV